MKIKMQLEDNLDPENWQEMAEYIARFSSDEIQELADSLKREVWKPVPEALKQVFQDEKVPETGCDLDQVVENYRQSIRPYRNGNTHPRFFGWVQGTGTIPALMADIAASALNSNCGGRDHGAVYIERQVVRWFKQIFGFPVTAGGLLTSGTSNSTHLAIQVAMFRKLGLDYKNKGFFGVSQPLRCYTSKEGHSSIIKAIQTCGIGSDNLIVVDTNDDHQILISELEQKIQQDIQLGYRPFMVIANAGTVNSGAFDDFRQVHELCQKYDCWMHVDGAFGAWMKIADRPYVDLTCCLEKADSLAFDFHKLIYAQYDCGGLLIRDGAFQQQVFSIRPNYLATHGQALAGGEPWFCDYGLELSRSFRGLKVWFTFKTYGIKKLGKAVTLNCKLAKLLAELIDQSPYWTRVINPASNIVTFRLSDEHARNNRICESIVATLQTSGDAVFSLTRHGKHKIIRASVTNHRTRESDIFFVMDRLNELAAEALNVSVQTVD